MPFALTDADRGYLVGVDARLVELVERLADVSPIPFKITEGVRTPERQKQLFAEKKTKTLKSRHITGHAVDIVPLVGGRPSWEWRHYTPVVKTAKKIAAEMNVRVVFGYDWGWDAPHIEVRNV